MHIAAIWLTGLNSRSQNIQKMGPYGPQPGADPGFDRGADHDRPKLPTVHSSVM